MENIFVARQPIYDRDLNVIGYELLYRNNEDNRAIFNDGTRASSQLISNTFLGIGLENLVGSQPAFINLTHDFFIDMQPIPMNPEQVVLEVRAETLPHEEVLNGLQQLAEKGYAIALDDFLYSPELEPLLKLATYVKLDLSAHSHEQLREQIALCRHYPVKLIAQKVETPEDLARCQELGFDQFQGFFFCHPQTVSGQSEPVDHGLLLLLMQRLEQANVDMKDVETLLIQDIVLSYKLLRYINCANYATRCEIDSMRDALALLGVEAIKKWVALLLMSSNQGSKPQELLNTSLVRARMCELLAQKEEATDPGQAFTVGLFSTLDAVMNIPMDELLDSVSLSSPIRFALLHQEGPLGELLKQVISYEHGEWAELGSGHNQRGDFVPAYLKAIQWSNQCATLRGA